jgi:hypothetical protein
MVFIVNGNIVEDNDESVGGGGSAYRIQDPLLEVDLTQ